MQGVYLRIDNALILNRHAVFLLHNVKLPGCRFATCRER